MFPFIHIGSPARHSRRLSGSFVGVIQIGTAGKNRTYLRERTCFTDRPPFQRELDGPFCPAIADLDAGITHCVYLCRFVGLSAHPRGYRR